jgi:hypothetical protein
MIGPGDLRCSRVGKQRALDEVECCEKRQFTMDLANSKLKLDRRSVSLNMFPGHARWAKLRPRRRRCGKLQPFEEQSLGAQKKAPLRFQSEAASFLGREEKTNRSSQEGHTHPLSQVVLTGDYIPMPPMPPIPPGIAGLLLSSSGISETMASVVSIKPAIDAAFCNAVRVTFAGSITPASTRSS